MTEHDCGEIPVLDSERKVVGVITDRDIACRVVAQGKDPKRTEARDVMSRPVVTATPETGVATVARGWSRIKSAGYRW